MSEPGLMGITGRPWSPAARPGHWGGCVPRNKGLRYSGDPPTVEEIILVMREAGAGPYADRHCGLIAILWRAGLRISEALSLRVRSGSEEGSVLIRASKGRCAGRSGWMTEAGSTSPPGRAPDAAADRPVVLRPRRG